MPYNETTGVEQADTDDPATPRTVRAIALTGVPPLTGADADIAAADPIRAARLIEADDILTALRGNETLTEEHTAAAIPPPPVSHAQVQQAQIALNRLRHQTEAAWWLSHRNDTAQALLNGLIEDTNSHVGSITGA